MLINKNKIRHKLLFAFSVLIFFSISFSGISYYFIHKINNYHQLKSDFHALSIFMLQARKAEKDFLANDFKNMEFIRDGNSSYLHDHRVATESIFKQIQNLKEDHLIKKLSLLETINEVSYQTDQYNQLFSKLVQMVRLRGFKDFGLEGEMRKNVHNLENDNSNLIAVSTVLMLRRHEKDFLLRKDQAYVKKLNDLVEKCKAELVETDSPAQQKEAVAIFLDNYQKTFMKIVKLESEIGDETTGLKHELKIVTDKAEPIINQLNAEVESKIDRFLVETKLLFLGSVLVLLGATIVISYVIARNVSRPIRFLDMAVQKAKTNGEMDEKYLSKISSNDEIGSLAKNFRIMMEEIKQNIRKIQDKNRELEVLAENDAKRTWVMEGLAKFGDILKLKFDSADNQFQEILFNLVKHLGVNQGALFILESQPEHPVLELKACYAYGRQKFLKKTVLPGEGLIGTAWLEKETVFVTDVPDQFAKITSGLGGANPRCVIIVPVKFNDEVEGVIELLSFKILEKHEIDFLEKLSERIGATISTMKMIMKLNAQ